MYPVKSYPLFPATLRYCRKTKSKNCVVPFNSQPILPYFTPIHIVSRQRSFSVLTSRTLEIQKQPHVHVGVAYTLGNQTIQFKVSAQCRHFCLHFGRPLQMAKLWIPPGCKKKTCAYFDRSGMEPTISQMLGSIPSNATACIHLTIALVTVKEL